MTLAIDKPVIVTEPGVYDMTEADYFGDPVPAGSLSNSGAKLLMPPSCPALYRYYADHEEAHKRHFEFGSAAHYRVLGAGPEIRVLEFANYTTKDAKEAKKQAYADGATPILRHEYDQVEKMAAAIKADPLAAALFNPAAGKPEQSMFWVDEQTGVWRRARLDWLPNPRAGRMIPPDYKTSVSVEPSQLRKSLANFQYYRQAATYEDGIKALGLADEVAFLFVAQMKTEPYLITIFDIDPEDVELGRQQNRQALEIYRDCQASGVWPSFTDGPIRLSLPSWERRKFEVSEW